MEAPGAVEIDRMPETLAFDISEIDNCSVMDRDGKPVLFKDIRKGYLCIFVFVRHFLDYITKEYVEDFSKILLRDVEKKNVKIVVIGCAASRFIQSFCDEANYPHEMFCDSRKMIQAKLGLYNTYQASYSENSSPHIKSNAFMGFWRTVWRSMKSMVEQGDPFQQGGQLVVDQDGKVLFFHRDCHPYDHTPLNDLLLVAGLERVDFKTNYKIKHM